MSSQISCPCDFPFSHPQVLTSAGTQAEVSSTTASIQTQVLVVLGWMDSRKNVLVWTLICLIDFGFLG